MKTKVLAFALMLFLVAGLSGQDLGKVSIKNASDIYPKFIVSMNGIRLTNEYSGTVSFDYLDEYTYKVRILQAGSARPLSFVVNSAPKYVSNYLLSRDNTGTYSLVLESKFLMGSQPEAMQPAVDPAGQLPAATSTTLVINSGPQLMTDADYQGVLAAIKKESFETGKLDLAKTFLGTPAQLISSAQVLGVIKLFSFENNRLSFAKFAYPYTQDKQNYYKVFEALSFSNSKNELTEYIRKNP